MADNRGTVAAIAGGCRVELSDGSTVLVKKWSYAKGLQIMELLEGVFKELIAATARIKASGDKSGWIREIIKLLGPRALEVARLTVAPEDRERINDEMDADDALAVILATLETNLTEAFLKNAKALGGKFNLLTPPGERKPEAEKKPE